jgi:poly-gamma-glutamate biosynthesis protein PgsC/CapC
LYVESIGLGLVVSLVLSETLGLAAGGMVVPGYIALYLDHPLRVAVTLLVALATYGVVRFMSNFVLIYGRRRTVIMILIGFALGWLTREILASEFRESYVELAAIGYIIPGLVANWMERQGVFATACTMVVAAVIVRMLLMIFTGGVVGAI